LIEYKQLRKSNAFIDRRFGEEDEGMDPEERAILRFQKQRMREAAKFALPDDDGNNDDGALGGETLTHLGRDIADFDDGGKGGRGGWGSDDDDFGDGGRALEELHFGGGFIPRKSAPDGGEGDVDGRHRTKKEVMEEVVAKSKAYKALKYQQREEDEAAADALDAQFTELAGGLLARMIRPKGSRFDKTVSGTGVVTEEDRRFDALTKELVFEAKAKPGERTLTGETTGNWCLFFIVQLL
jgi:nucleolar protein 14